jgi:predicted nucleic acid-binding Zn ribbon protein
MGSSSEGARAKRGEASLRRLLEGVLANLNLRGQFREHLAVLAWPGVAGKVVAAHAQAEGVRDGVLMVATDTPAWAQELQMRRRALLERVAAEVGAGVIRDIHFRSGLRRRRGKPPAREPRPGEVKLSGRQERRACAAAAPIEDPDLRARAERAFLALTRMEQWRKQTGWRRCRRCGQWQRAGRHWCSSCAYSGTTGRRGRLWGGGGRGEREQA